MKRPTTRLATWSPRRHKHRSAHTADPFAGSPLGQWTNGSNLKTKAATVVLLGALVLSPAGLVVGLTAASGGPPTATTPRTVDTRGEQAAVEEFACRFVTTWLVADADNAEDLLSGLVEIPDSAEFPSERQWASDPMVADVAQVDGETWAVTVAVSVSPSASAPAVRRFYRVPVRDDSGRLVALALPAPTAAPGVAGTPDLGYPSDLGPGHPAWGAVAGFLSALLAGKGDITRYLTPGTRVAPVAPVAFAAIRINQVAVNVDVGAEPPRAPGDGQQLAVLVTAIGLASASAGGGLTVQYALVLTGRDGRWEVTEVEASPHIQGGVGDGTGEPSDGGAPVEEEQ